MRMTAIVADERQRRAPDRIGAASATRLGMANVVAHVAATPTVFRRLANPGAAAPGRRAVKAYPATSSSDVPHFNQPLLDALKQSVARTQSASATADASATTEPAGPAKRQRSA